MPRAPGEKDKMLRSRRSSLWSRGWSAGKRKEKRMGKCRRVRARFLTRHVDETFSASGFFPPISVVSYIRGRTVRHRKPRVIIRDEVRTSRSEENWVYDVRITRLFRRFFVLPRIKLFTAVKWLNSPRPKQVPGPGDELINPLVPKSILGFFFFTYIVYFGVRIIPAGLSCTEGSYI